MDSSSALSAAAWCQRSGGAAPHHVHRDVEVARLAEREQRVEVRGRPGRHDRVQLHGDLGRPGGGDRPLHGGEYAGAPLRVVGGPRRVEAQDQRVEALEVVDPPGDH